MRDGRLLYLSRADIARVDGGSARLYVDAVERALRLHAGGLFVQPLKPYLKWRGPDNHVADRIIAMPAYLGGESPTAGIKWIGSKHDNPTSRGLDRASALVILNDVESHYPLAVLEGGLISNRRTAAVTVLAVRHLARERFRSLTCIGCGPIGRMQVRMLLEESHQVDRITLFDLDRAAAEGHAAELRDERCARLVEVAEDAASAVRGAEVVITATVATQPYLPYAWLSPGTFVCNVSIMDVCKDVFIRADKVVVDDWDQCNREKKVIHQLVEEGLFSRGQLHAELGEILLGRRPGRQSADEIILLNPMGMALEDLACARAIYDSAVAQGVGTWLPL